MDLETIVRNAGGAPPGAVPHAAILRKAGRRRVLRRTSLGVGAIAVVGVALGVLTQAPRSVEFEPVGPTGEQATEGAAVGDGWENVSFHGMEISVPAAWTLNDTKCGEPRRDTVILPFQGGTPMCGTRHRPGLTVAWFATTEGRSGQAWADVATEPTEVSGHPAFKGTGKARLAREPRTVLVVPGIDVVLSVTLGDKDLAERIIDSARVVDIDHNGCDTDVGRVAVSGANAPEDALVPAGPSSSSVCRYVDGAIARSVRLPGGVAAALARTMNALDPVAEQSARPGCQRTNPRRGFIVRFEYPDASTANVAAYLDDCRLRVDNGVRSGRIDSVVLRALVDAAGYDAGLSEEVVKGEGDGAVTTYLSMRMAADVVPVGFTPRAIIENSAPISFQTGQAFTLEKRSPAGWRTVNAKQGFRAVGVVIEAASSHGFDVAVYIDSPRAVPLRPGRYRVSKTVYDVGGDVRLSAQFTVTS